MAWVFLPVIKIFEPFRVADGKTIASGSTSSSVKKSQFNKYRSTVFFHPTLYPPKMYTEFLYVIKAT